MSSCSDGEEDFVTFGTPLEPLEEDEPLRKPVPLHEQTVKDERGRYQRFHGAFTGGFSAGYFNTVGSKEGWTPSTFVSSRQQKAGKHHARPEDFMDDEDFGEHGIAPSDICRSEEFSSSRRDAAAEKKKAVSSQAALIPGDTLLEELIAPARLTIGVELLRRMGWKEGQGVGPRVKRKARRQAVDPGPGLLSTVLPPAGSEESEEDEEEFAPQNVTFAPKDVTPVDFTPRLGLQGLGYRGLDPGRALLGPSAPEHIQLFRPQAEGRSLFGGAGSTARRGGVAGQAFGVGALEDDDDEEVYHRDSMSRYDTELGGEEPGDGLYGWTAPQQYTKKTERSRDASYVGKILEGFTLAQKPTVKETIFSPPVLPRDFRPVRRLRPSLDVAALSSVSPALAEALRTSRGRMVTEEPQEGGRHQLDSDQRRTMLGEDVLKGPASVLDLLRPEDRQRLLSLRNASNPPSSNPPLSNPPSSNPPSSRVPLVPGAGLVPGGASASQGLQQQQQALVAWRGVQESSQSFRPFEKNPSKQARYEDYLNRLKQGHRDALDQSVDSSMTEWERSRERDEFVRASILYRPSSSSLSSRFTRAKQEDDQDTVEERRDQEGDEDDKQSAVKMKMFGAMTRETFEWHPDKLLCKRFNVPHPFPGSGFVGLPKIKRDKFSVFNFLTVNENKETPAPLKPPESLKKSRWDVSEQRSDQPAAPPAASHPTASTKSENEPVDQQNSEQEEEQEKDQKEKEKEEEEEEEEEKESRPPMDLFKAIFEGSSDDKSSSSEEEQEEENEEEGHTNAQQLNLFNITTSSSVKPSSITSSSVTTSSTVGSSKLSGAAAPPHTPSVKEEEQEEFGPKLPPPSAALLRGGAVIQEEAHSRRSREKKHKNKKQHKHKKEKKKKKHKKKKHRAKEPKRSEEEEEEEVVSTDELLRRLKSVS